jgi:UDP-glucuronate decarboxylase
VIDLARIVKEMTGSRSPVEFRPLPSDDPRRRRPDIRRATALLNWAPRVDLRTGLRHTIRHFERWLLQDRAAVAETLRAGPAARGARAAGASIPLA